MSTVPKQPLSVADYLRIEQETGERHQFFAGEVFLMAGGAPKHNAIAANITGELRRVLHDGPCRVFNSDQKIRVQADGLCSYPDAAVVCDEPQLDNAIPNAIANPTVLVEVLSDSTADYDRGAKFHSYRQIPTLKQYIIVYQHERLVEWYVRTDDYWKLMELREGAVPVIVGESQQLEIDLAEIYLKTEML